MKRAHTNKTESEKIEVINYVELHSTVSRKKMANLFDLKESTLSGWIKNKDALKQSFFTGTSVMNARRKFPHPSKKLSKLPYSNSSDGHEATHILLTEEL